MIDRCIHPWIVCLVLAWGIAFGGGRKPGDNPTVAAEKARWSSEGWEFVAVVGTSGGTMEAREVRYSDPTTGSLTVIAPSSGLPGESKGPHEERTFQERGYRFLEVKIMTSAADGYGIVFRKKT